MLSKWGKLLQFRGGWIWSLFRGIFERVFGCYPISSFREKSWKIEGKEGKALLKLIIYHNLFVKVGVLHLLVLVAHVVSCLCYCVVHLYAFMHVGYVWEGLLNAFFIVSPSCCA